MLHWDCSCSNEKRLLVASRHVFGDHEVKTFPVCSSRGTLPVYLMRRHESLLASFVRRFELYRVQSTKR